MLDHAKNFKNISSNQVLFREIWIFDESMIEQSEFSGSQWDQIFTVYLGCTLVNDSEAKLVYPHPKIHFQFFDCSEQECFRFFELPHLRQLPLKNCNFFIKLENMKKPNFKEFDSLLICFSQSNGQNLCHVFVSDVMNSKPELKVQFIIGQRDVQNFSNFFFVEIFFEIFSKIFFSEKIWTNKKWSSWCFEKSNRRQISSIGLESFNFIFKWFDSQSEFDFQLGWTWIDYYLSTSQPGYQNFRWLIIWY